jgi:DNA repair exonuclease SbcCD ATPase subunit
MTPRELSLAFKVFIREFEELKAKVQKLESEHVNPEQVIEAIRQIHGSNTIASKPIDQAKLEANIEKIRKAQKLCPHCGEQPAYFFHVRKCSASKNKNNKGVNGEEANRQ